MVYWFLMILCFIFSMAAQARVKSTFNKYSRVMAKADITGEQAALKILRLYSLPVRVEGISGSLTDNYDPRGKVLRLSDVTRNSSSIAAIGVAAHEAGHAIQDGVHYLPNTIRSSLVPLANIGSTGGPYLAIIGVMLNSYSDHIGLTLAYVGLALYLFAFAFYIVTLPVEFNASSRAIKVLGESGILDPDELKGAKKVLSAAAMTYVASAASALITLLRLFFIVGSSRDRSS